MFEPIEYPQSSPGTCIHLENVTLNINVTKADESSYVNHNIPMCESVMAFAEEMQARLDEKEGQPGKTGWSEDDKFALLDRLRNKVVTLSTALQYAHSAEIIRELGADVGNYAMMIADNEGELRG